MLLLIYQFGYHMEYLDPGLFLQQINQTKLIDVRSPAEFDQGHIPGAVNLPLFDNEERKVVGTLYKNSGRETSVLAGLDFVGLKMSGFIKEIKKQTSSKEIFIYCWRGGMRSAGMAWLFEFSGFYVSVLKGGYKAYRNYIRDQFDEPLKLRVLGGKTGSGKTEILYKIAELGEQIIDLEKLAHHKGSAFGDLGQEKQPTIEWFENLLYEQLSKLNLQNRIWVEDESLSIGTVIIPKSFFLQMRMNPVIFLDIDISVRIKRLVEEYGSFSKEQLINAVNRITKRLGGLATKQSIESILENDLETTTSLLLVYYDKGYLKGLSKRDPDKVFHLNIDNYEVGEIARQVIEKSDII